jgi:hypothetical protein
MKGLSIIFTILLFVLASLLAQHLRQAGTLPAEKSVTDRSLVAMPATSNLAGYQISQPTFD